MAFSMVNGHAVLDDQLVQHNRPEAVDQSGHKVNPDPFDLQTGIALARDARGTKVFQRIADTTDRHDDAQCVITRHIRWKRLSHEQWIAGSTHARPLTRTQNFSCIFLYKMWTVLQKPGQSDGLCTSGSWGWNLREF